MKYSTVIFDLDGTLLNTLEDLMDSVNYSLRAMGYPEKSAVFRYNKMIEKIRGKGLLLLPS